ncbi:MAG: CIA30 family protein [Gammaproteobacteria bacterium]|nr:CIA30 family protein [Gammaproteobacteria bacterium]
MDNYGRSLIASVGTAALSPFMKSWADQNLPTQPHKGMLSSFTNGYMMPGTAWRGFSDRVMGGISTAELSSTRIGGKNCIRLTGNVTRESNGGFVQMALSFGADSAEFDASRYAGIELQVYGNNEDYNVHVRTADCGWHSQSYRTTFFAESCWQRIRLPWETFTGNNLDVPLDKAHLRRIGILGWMREFKADIALAEIALYS